MITTEEQLTVTCMDFFVAGSDTTTTTLKFCILYLILNPSILKKAQDEIDNEIGKQRFITLEDRHK